MNTGRVSILGCGWLGVPLGKHLLQRGYSVNGSVTSAEKLGFLKSLGIKPFKLLLNENSLEIDDLSFFETDCLIISIPPRRIEGIERIFPAQIEQLIPVITEYKIRKVIFISSTSVYPENKQNATENDILQPQKASGKALILAENLLTVQPEFKTTIVRFGGLIGADRNPARFLQKSRGLVANVPVNLIHQDDCIGIIASILEKELWGETLNACCPEHPLKKDFYGKAAGFSGLTLPEFSDEDGEYKIVNSSKLVRMLDYSFQYASPIDYLTCLNSSHN